MQNNNMRNYIRIFTWLTVFSISMGFLESAVVIYLRELYYPNGFSFPLMPIGPRVALTEFLREIATVIMLIGIGALAGRTRVEKFASFIYCFAIWDLFYYVFLKLILDWPESLFTWDILFLIPLPWVGPVLAPCIVAVTLIVLAFTMVYSEYKCRKAQLKFQEKILLFLGCSIILFSFAWDYLMHTLNSGGIAWIMGKDQRMFAELVPYIPAHFNWWIFCLGEGIICWVIFNYIRGRKL